MVGHIFRKLNLGANSITTSDRSIAGVEWRIVDTLALGPVKGLASEPVIVPALLTLLAVWAEVASLTIDVLA